MPSIHRGFVRVETENAKINAGSVPCREVKQREEYKDTNEPKSIYVEERETTKRGKYLSFFVFDSAFTFLHNKLTRRRKTLIQNMSNPVVFFDMEIGGQPAGRIEMTVRIRIVSVLFYAKCFLLLLSQKR
jgi:hypothetical protein